ncbi:MAG: molybdopterin-dependent oxidoreductase [Brevefilum sp.]
MADKNRLPPGQHPTSGFPTLHYGPLPAFNPANWDFRIWGAVEEPVTWTWDQVSDLPRVKIRLDLHCVTAWSKLETEWEGISPKMLVEQGLITPTPEARFVLQHAAHGYTTNLPLAVFLQDNFLLATHYQGEPLTPEHGYPLRGVTGAIPGRTDLQDVYLWKGAKWLRGLEFMTQDRLGFWEANGYHNEGDVWKEQRTAR